MPAPVRARRVDSIDEVAEAGTFEFYVHSDDPDRPRGMIYACPCGCGRQGALPFHPRSEDDVTHKRAAWNWNGNREAPTLTPSVHHKGHWHGYLRDGVWSDAS